MWKKEKKIYAYLNNHLNYENGSLIRKIQYKINKVKLSIFEIWEMLHDDEIEDGVMGVLEQDPTEGGIELTESNYFDSIEDIYENPIDLGFEEEDKNEEYPRIKRNFSKKYKYAYENYVHGSYEGENKSCDVVENGVCEEDWELESVGSRLEGIVFLDYFGSVLFCFYATITLETEYTWYVISCIVFVYLLYQVLDSLLLIILLGISQVNYYLFQINYHVIYFEDTELLQAKKLPFHSALRINDILEIAVTDEFTAVVEGSYAKLGNFQILVILFTFVLLFLHEIACNYTFNRKIGHSFEDDLLIINIFRQMYMPEYIQYTRPSKRDTDYTAKYSTTTSRFYELLWNLKIPLVLTNWEMMVKRPRGNGAQRILGFYIGGRRDKLQKLWTTDDEKKLNGERVHEMPCQSKTLLKKKKVKKIVLFEIGEFDLLVKDIKLEFESQKKIGKMLLSWTDWIYPYYFNEEKEDESKITEREGDFFKEENKYENIWYYEKDETQISAIENYSDDPYLMYYKNSRIERVKPRKNDLRKEFYTAQYILKTAKYSKKWTEEEYYCDDEEKWGDELQKWTEEYLEKCFKVLANEKKVEKKVEKKRSIKYLPKFYMKLNPIYWIFKSKIFNFFLKILVFLLVKQQWKIKFQKLVITSIIVYHQKLDVFITVLKIIKEKIELFLLIRMTKLFKKYLSIKDDKKISVLLIVIHLFVALLKIMLKCLGYLAALYAIIFEKILKRDNWLDDRGTDHIDEVAAIGWHIEFEAYIEAVESRRTYPKPDRFKKVKLFLVWEKPKITIWKWIRLKLNELRHPETYFEYGKFDITERMNEDGAITLYNKKDYIDDKLLDFYSEYGLERYKEKKIRKWIWKELKNKILRSNGIRRG